MPPRQSTFRFTTRDLLWLTVIAGLATLWWIELEDSRRLRRERDEALAKWHHASQKWVEATRLIPPLRNSGGIGGGGGMGGGGFGGRAPDSASPAADEAADEDDKENSRK